MKAILVKSIALVLIVTFAFVLLPQRGDAQIIGDCVAARLACAAAQAGADHVCDTMNRWWCNLARRMADAVCDEADEICGGG